MKYLLGLVFYYSVKLRYYIIAATSNIMLFVWLIGKGRDTTTTAVFLIACFVIECIWIYRRQTNKKGK